jgi:nucleoside-diphosphate-sugar epimerase
VFHVAAETRDGQPAARYDAVNLQSVTTLLELAPRLGVERVVHTSHYFAIGRSGEPRSAKGFVNDEYWTHDPGDMHDAHELSKNDAENSVNQRVSLGEPVLALIPTMLYGPELRAVSAPDGLAHGNRIVRLLSEHARGRYPGVPGDGTQLWNLVHVEDVAAAHVTVMDAVDPSGSPHWPPPRWTHWHYLCGGENVPLDRLFELFGKLAGVPAPKHVQPRTGLLGKLFGGRKDEPGRTQERFLMDSHSWAYRSDLAAREWGYRSRPLAAGLEQTVAWMRSSGLLG